MQDVDAGNSTENVAATETLHDSSVLDNESAANLPDSAILNENIESIDTQDNVINQVNTVEVTNAENDVDNVESTPTIEDVNNDQTVEARNASSELNASCVMQSTEAQGNLQEKVSVSDVVINLNQVLEDCHTNTAVDGNEPKENNNTTEDSTKKNTTSTSSSILAKYINEARQRPVANTGSLQLQRNLHLLERNNVQITDKQGHMLNNSVSIYPSKSKSVESTGVSESGSNQNDLLGRMHGIVQNVGNQPNQGYKVAVPMQHFIQYPHRMVTPYSMAQHSTGHIQMQGIRSGNIQLQERSNPPPLIPFQNQMSYPSGQLQLQLQRHPGMQMQAPIQSTFQGRMMHMPNKMQQIPQLIPKMAVQMQYPSYYAVQNRFPSNLSPNGSRERPMSDPNSMNVSGMNSYRMSNIHAENYERYPRSYSEPQEETNRLNSEMYQQELYHDNPFQVESYQGDGNINTGEMFYRNVSATSDRPLNIYQSKANHSESGVRHTAAKQSVLQKNLERPSHVINTQEADKVITKREFVENIDEATLDESVEEFVDFEEAANLNVYTEQHDGQVQEEGENFHENMSIEHFLQVDYSDNANDQMRQNEEHQEQQVQRQGQPLYQMNRQKTIIFKCKYCKKKFFHKRELEKHMITHSTYTRVRSDGKKRDFPCTLCDCSYIRKTHLERHMVSHMRKQDQYKCTKCNYFFVHRRHLEIHNLQTHSGRSEEDNDYDEHIQIVSVDPNAPDYGNESEISIVKIKEEMIDNIDTRPVPKPMHKPLHKHSNVNRSFFCQHCGRAFLKNQYLRAHIRNFHDGNFSETTATEISENRPFNPFTQQKKLFCPVCGQGFIKMKYFRSHWNKFHEQEHETRTDISKKTNPVPLNAPPPPLVKKPFVCHICNNGFYHPQNLKRHIRDVHYKKKLESKGKASSDIHAESSGKSMETNKKVEKAPSKAPSRGSSKALAPSMKKRGNRGSRAFCPICCKEFLYEYNVRRHIRNSHPDNIGMAPVKTRPVQVAAQEDQEQDQEEEQDQSITLSNLSNINESQLMGWNMDDENGENPSTSQSTGERPFKCTLCDKRFFRMLFLKRHFGTSHGMSHPDTTEADWSFECQACGKRFARNDSLIRHMKLKHRKLFRSLRAEKIRQNYETASKALELKEAESEPKNTNEEPDHSTENMVEETFETSQETETDPFEDVPTEDTSSVAPKLKIFRCGTCSDSFCTKLEYIKHQRTVHARQRKHKCKFCSLKFAQYAHLRRHLTTAHAAKQSGATKKCSKCEFTATNNIALSNHMRAHTREEASKRYSMRQSALSEIENQTDHESPVDDDIESRVEEEIGMHFEEESEIPGEELDNQLEEDTESQFDEEIDAEDSPENVSDSLAETFNESLAKRLDETLAETMANVLDENTDENTLETDDGTEN